MLMDECTDCPPAAMVKPDVEQTRDIGFIECRRSVCETCSEKQVRFISIPFKRIHVESCKVCGCPLVTRLLTTCPRGRW